ncbi:MAG: DUF5012 domain-containing protein, partial [Prevotellaceae bacterium]|nr:DUF5012 domain-containing protein [Prevotellaceae bacterium]
MKAFKISLLSLFAIALLSCKKETADLSSTIHYVSFHIKGENPAVVQVGEVYTDAGVLATLQGKDVTSTITIESNVDHEAMGMYKVEYTAVNADGLKSRAIRDVIVCNPNVTEDLSGRYTTQTGTERLTLASGALIPYPGYHATITRLAPGFFSINDFLGGYYAERVYPQYGYTVMGMTGHFALNE